MKKPPDSSKAGNEGIQRFHFAPAKWLASSFSLTEKLIPHERNHDEHS
jgi:hypothetical protein